MLAASFGPGLHAALLHDHGHACDSAQSGWQMPEHQAPSAHDAHSCSICAFALAAALPVATGAPPAALPANMALPADSDLAHRPCQTANRQRGPPHVLPQLG
jgi:hypothetical protein